MSRDNWGGMEPQNPTNPMSQFEKTTKSLEYVFTFKPDLEMVLGPQVSRIENIYRILKEHVQKALVDQEVRVTGHNIMEVQFVLDLITDIYITREISQVFHDLAFGLNLLTHNWNDNIAKDPVVAQKIRLLDRLINNKLTMQEVTDVLKRLILKAEQALKYAPAAYRVSEHYQKSLEAITDEQNKSARSDCS